MEVKKNPEVKIENKRPMLFLLGLVTSLAVILMAFEFSVFEGQVGELGELKVELEEEEMVPITQREVKPPPPPPPKAIELEIVEDDEEIEEVEIEVSEIDEDTEIEIIEEEEEVVEEIPIFTIVEDMPSLPGCEGLKGSARDQCTQKKIFEYLGKNLKYPPMAKDAGIKGIVYVRFEIDEKGKVKSPEVLRGIGGGCDEEALRVVQNMPKFYPGKQRGKPVRVSYNLPIRFILR